MTALKHSLWVAILMLMATLGCGGHPTVQLEIVTIEFHGGVAGQYYYEVLHATGCDREYSKYTWELLDGQELPPGLTLAKDTGIIEGYPSYVPEQTKYEFWVKVSCEKPGL